MLSITLTPTHQTFHLSRDQILTTLPDSLLGQIIETEPDVPEIRFDNPDVTPEAMQVLQDYLNGIEPNHTIPNLSPTARYLNIPWLIYYEDPLYDKVVNPIQRKLGYSWNLPQNQALLTEAAKQNDLLMVNYLLQKGVQQEMISGVNREGGYAFSPALNAAIDNDNLAMVQLLHSVIQSHPSDDDYIGRAIVTNKTDIALKLLQKPEYQDYLILYLQMAARRGNIPIVLDLLTKTDPSKYDNAVLKEAIYWNQSEVVKILLSDPRINPATIQPSDIMFRTVLPSHLNDAATQLLRQDGRLPDYFYRA